MAVPGKISPASDSSASSCTTSHLTIALIATGDLVPKAQTVALGCLTLLISAASAVDA